MKQKVINKVLEKTGIPNLINLLVNRLSFGELQSLLIELFDQKVALKKVNEIFDEYHNSRFVKPSDIDPINHRKLELAIFELLPPQFQIIDLSPLTPMGTSSVLTTVHQNNVISTIRNTEVAADTTNILALECAKRRKVFLQTNTKCQDLVKLCASQRVTRAQPFNDKNFSAYFNVIALCSAGRDTGNDKFETTNLNEHIQFYLRIIEELVNPEDIKTIKLKFFIYQNENKPLIDHINGMAFPNRDIEIQIENNSEFGKNYYRRLRYMISLVNQNDMEYDYIDGGFTDWTSKLLNNKKERLLTSGIGTDLLLRTIKCQLD